MNDYGQGGIADTLTKNGSVGYRCERHNEKRQGAWLPAVEVSGVMMARPTLLRHHGVHRLLCGRFVCRLLTREDTSFDAHGVLLGIVGSGLVLTVPNTARGAVDVGELMHLHALTLNGVLEVGNYLPAVAVIPAGAVRLEHIRNVVAIPCSDDLSLVTLRSVVLFVVAAAARGEADGHHAQEEEHEDSK